MFKDILSSRIVNYIGQLRLYSLIPLVLLTTTITREWIDIVSLSLLWVGFLVYLEVSHKDPFRLHFFPYLWVPFIIPALIVRPYEAVAFLFFSYLYTKKKDGVFWGTTSSLWRGCQDFSLAIFTNPLIAGIALVFTACRNAIGDVRDAGHDKESGTNTLSVLLGMSKNYLWGYWGHLGLILASSVLWWYFSLFTIPLYILSGLLVLQILSYPLTPRVSGPKVLNIYRID